MSKLPPRRKPSKRKAAKVARERIAKIFQRKRLSKFQKDFIKMQREILGDNPFWDDCEFIDVEQPIGSNWYHSGIADFLDEWGLSEDAGHPTHTEGHELHSRYLDENEEKISVEQDSRNRVPVNPNDNPNVGIIICGYKYKGKKYLRISTATVVGKEKRYLITCAHNIVGLPGKNLTWWPDVIRFHRGAYLSYRASLDGNGNLKLDKNDAAKRWETKEGNVQEVDMSKDQNGTWNNICVHDAWFKAQEADYDVALLRLPKKCKLATKNIRFLDYKGKLPRYFRLDGYPKLTLEEASALSNLPANVTKKLKREMSSDQRLLKSTTIFRQSQMMGGRGNLIPTYDLQTFDHIYRTVYATTGQSGSPLFVTNQCGQIDDWTMFAMHQRGNREPDGKCNHLQAVILGEGMQTWIKGFLPNQFDPERKLAHGLSASANTTNPANDSFVNALGCMGDFMMNLDSDSD